MASVTSAASLDFTLFCPLKFARHLRRPFVRAGMHPIATTGGRRPEIFVERESAVLHHHKPTESPFRRAWMLEATGTARSTRPLPDRQGAFRSPSSKRRACSTQGQSLPLGLKTSRNRIARQKVRTWVAPLGRSDVRVSQIQSVPVADPTLGCTLVDGTRPGTAIAMKNM